MSHPGGGYSEVKVGGIWYRDGSDEEIDALAQQTAIREAERDEARRTSTYSPADYTRFVYELIEKSTGARIINVFAEQGFVYVKLDQEVRVDLVAGIILRDAGITVYEVPGDGSYVVLKGE